MIDLAIISNVPTPYRLHVLRRVAHELPEVKLHSLFTHADSGSGMAWDLELETAINPVTFGDDALRPGDVISRRALRLFARLRDYITRHHVRFIVLLGYNDLARLRLIRWAKRKNIPLLITGDSNVHSETRLAPFKRRVKRMILKRVLRDAAGLMPMGSAGRAFFGLYDSRDLPIFLFPYEPDYAALMRRDTAAEKAFRAGHGLAEGRKRLLYCGRLVGVKRVDVLIEAYMRTANDSPEWDLVIAGDGPLKTELLAQASAAPAAIRDRIKWLGFLQFDATVLCYHSCDALALPSEYEPWALVVNEAVAAGLAVVSTNISGAAIELVKPGVNGLLVPPGNVDAMVVALLEITRPGRCEQMQAAAQAVLAKWRAAADPVEGVRNALRHFKLLV